MTVDRRTQPEGEIARLGPDQAPAVHTGSAAAGLIAAAQKARAAAEFAELVCRSAFVPEQYRGKPAEAAAAILAGDELGFSPMASLRTFDNIQGVASPKAITQRAVVQARGHDIWPVESSATRAVVRGRRKGTTEIVESVWTIERADLAGFVKKNPNYRTQPTSMLIARATAECSRWVASDALLGMPYSSEELRDDHLLTAPSPEQEAAGVLPPARAARGRGRTTAATLTGDPEPIDAADPAQPATGDGVDRDALWADVRAAFDAAGVTDRAVVARVVGRLVEGVTEADDLGNLSNEELSGLLDSLVDLGVDGITSIVSDAPADAAWPEPAQPGSGNGSRKGGGR